MAEIIKGGDCKDCGMPYAVGGPHLVPLHCVSALKACNVQLEARIQKARIIAARLGLISKGAWLMISKTEGSAMAFKYQDLADVPPSAAVRIEEQEAQQSFLFVAHKQQ